MTENRPKTICGFNASCVCGGTGGNNADNCERCRMLAELQRQTDMSHAAADAAFLNEGTERNAMPATPYSVCRVTARDGSNETRGWAVYRASNPVLKAHRLSPVYRGQAAKLRAKAFLDGLLLMHFTREKLAPSPF